MKLSQIDDYFFKLEQPTSLALFRIFYSLLVILTLLLLWPDLQVWYTDQGPVPFWLANKYLGSPRLNLLAFLPQTESWIKLFFGITFLAAFCLCIGLFSRTSSIILFVFLTSIHHRNVYILHSGDTLMRILSFLIIFTPCGKTLSLDQYFKEKRISFTCSTLFAPWSLRLIQFQIAWVYFTTSLFKIQGDTWKQGTTLYYVFRMDDFRRFPIPAFLDSDFISSAMSYGSVALELSLGTLIFVPRLRLPLIAAGILFHIGIEYSMNIPIFELLMIVCLLTFIPSELIALILDFPRRLNPHSLHTAFKRAGTREQRG